MLCSACGHSFTLSTQEYDETVKKNIQNRGPSSGDVFECPNCSKAAAREALKCPKCGNVFIPDWGREKDYADRCPKCRFSEIEQEQRKK
jgi:DNA-directed RNA polymerase subunit M/transcription elongation factor TFIIS